MYFPNRPIDESTGPHSITRRAYAPRSCPVRTAVSDFDSPGLSCFPSHRRRPHRKRIASRIPPLTLYASDAGS